MRLRTTTLVTAALLGTGPVGLAALPAAAAACTAPEVVSTAASPRTVVVGSTGTDGFDVRLAVRANGCQVSAVGAVATSPTKTARGLALTAVSTVDDVTTYAGRVDLDAADLDNADAGTWRVRTATQWAGAPPVEEGSADDATDVDNPLVSTAKVSVVAASQLTADATSAAMKKNKIRKGKAVTVEGALVRADWESADYTGYAKQRVELQFRTTTGSYKKVKSVNTRAGGRFTTTVKATRDGCFRVLYAGSKTTAAAPSTAECLDVR